MIDLNTLVSNALTAAVQQAVAPLNERIATLESANDILHKTQHEDMLAMRDRITAIEDSDDRLVDDIFYKVQVQQANITAALAERIAKLELCNAEHHQRLLVLEGALTDRVVALENNPAQGVDTQATPTTGLTREQVEAMIEQSMDHHLECYDHDNYDEMASKVDDLPDNLDDYATRDELRSEIEDVLNNATLSLSI